MRHGIHVNGMERFRGRETARLVKRQDIRRHLFDLHLKDCECRFNFRQATLTLLPELLGPAPLNSSRPGKYCARP